MHKKHKAQATDNYIRATLIIESFQKLVDLTLCISFFSLKINIKGNIFRNTFSTTQTEKRGFVRRRT